MARSLVPKRRKRRSSHVRSSLGLGTLLVALTGVNVYFFFFRADTAVRTGVEIPSNHELRTVSHAIAIIAGAGSLIGVLKR